MRQNWGGWSRSKPRRVVWWGHGRPRIWWLDRSSSEFHHVSGWWYVGGLEHEFYFPIIYGIILPNIIELDDGKIYRKPLYLMVKTMVSCRFSLKPIHWDQMLCVGYSSPSSTPTRRWLTPGEGGFDGVGRCERHRWTRLKTTSDFEVGHVKTVVDAWNVTWK